MVSWGGMHEFRYAVTQKNSPNCEISCFTSGGPSLEVGDVVLVSTHADLVGISCGIHCIGLGPPEEERRVTNFDRPAFNVGS